MSEITITQVDFAKTLTKLTKLIVNDILIVLNDKLVQFYAINVNRRVFTKIEFVTEISLKEEIICSADVKQLANLVKGMKRESLIIKIIDGKVLLDIGNNSISTKSKEETIIGVLDPKNVIEAWKDLENLTETLKNKVRFDGRLLSKYLDVCKKVDFKEINVTYDLLALEFHAFNETFDFKHTQVKDNLVFIEIGNKVQFIAYANELEQLILWESYSPWITLNFMDENEGSFLSKLELVNESDFKIDSFCGFLTKE